MSDDLDDIRSFNQKRGPTCQAGLVLAAMPVEIREKVEEAVKDQTIEQRGIVRWLKVRHDITISDHSFSRHVAGRCRCE